MKTYNITVNGVTYTVSVEEVNGAAVPAPAAAPAPTAAPAPVAAPAPKAAPAPAKSGATGAITVKAPMPGNIIKVNAKVGASVKKGDVLIVLEAMKMENDICAPEDGTVASIEVAQGATVETDAVLVTLN
jgi:biotin carboxyl carrier protein